MGNRRGLTPVKLRKLRVQDLCVKYYLEGRTYMEVIKRLAEDKYTVSMSSVSKYINESIKLWRAEQNELISEHKLIELQKINKIEVEAWEAWELSKKPQEVVQYKYEPGKSARAKGKYKELSKNVKTGAGNEKFLNLIFSCTEKRLELVAGLIQSEIVANQVGKGSTTNKTVRNIIFTSSRETILQSEVEEITTINTEEVN